MIRSLWFLSLAAVFSSAGAQQADPLQAPACRDAVARLDAAEQALLTRRAGAAASAKGGEGAEPAAALAALRREASLACFGSATVLPPMLPRAAQAPTTVEPAAPGASTPARPAVSPPGAPVVVPPVARPRAVPAAPAPTYSIPTQPPPPVTILSCDAAGCQASDGTRLNRAGPVLIGPRGACSVQGSVVVCP